MKSTIVKRSIVIGGHRTSVSLEDAFWSDLQKIAQIHQATRSDLIAEIDRTREQGNLSSAIRLFVLEHFRNKDRRTEADADRTAMSAERSQAIQP